MSNYNTPYQLMDDRGNLFRNTKKKNENGPDFTGKLKLNGKEFILSAWEKKTKNGDPFFSLSLGKDITEQPAGKLSQHNIDKSNGYAPADKKNDLDDDIPF